MKHSRVPIIHLAGTARERGRQHGEICQDDIRHLQEIWRRHVGFSNQDRRLYMQKVLAESDYVRAFTNHAPHLLEELQGIAEGAGLEFNAVFEMQLLDEEWSYRSRIVRRNSQHHHCSAVGLRAKDQSIIVAQNFDGVSWMDGFQRLFLHDDRESGQRMLIFSLPGLLALNGINDRSVAVCVNSLVQLDGDKAGLPVMGMIRLILGEDSYQDATTILRQTRSGSGQNYLIGGRDGYGSFEASGKTVMQVVASGPESPVVHTNHPLINPDDTEYSAMFRQLSPESQSRRTANSLSRYEQLQAVLARHEPHSVQELGEIFSSTKDAQHPLSREKPSTAASDTVIDYTVASTIFELCDQPLLHISNGPPSCHPYHTLAPFEASARWNEPG